jgi:glucose/arabinose dehydrogenase
MGLLSVAFHPRFPETSEIFVSYTYERRGSYFSRVSRFSWDARGVVRPSTETLVLDVQQPYSNHNGGLIRFGPDGYLYVGLGDGGHRDDPHGHGQNIKTLLGSLLRLDVDHRKPYSVPDDNPFAARPGRPEIFAWGFRNPWRFSFDSMDGALWVGDVGQNSREEVAVVRLGENHGWNRIEGDKCFRKKTCDRRKMTAPVWSYEHGIEGRSVTGGYVYRGKAIPKLVGHYIFGDFVSGRIWAFDPVKKTAKLMIRSKLQISSFARSPRGELFVLSYGEGAVYRIQPTSP